MKELNVEEKKRMTDRAQRFGKQGTTEGNRNFRKKISIDELLKRTLVSVSVLKYRSDACGLSIACSH